MVRILVMQAMAIHPGDWIYVDRERVVHDGDGFDEPVLIVKGTMSDSEMKNVGQIQAAEKPAKNKINRADQQSFPWSQVSRSGIHARQHVGTNNQIAREIVYFHDRSSSGVFKQKSKLVSKTKWRTPMARTSSSGSPPICTQRLVILSPAIPSAAESHHAKDLCILSTP